MHEPPTHRALSHSEARVLVAELVRAARQGTVSQRSAAATDLLRLDGRAWLALDDAARGPAHLPGTVVGGEWDLADAAGGALVAAVASWHVDGHVREGACARLALTPSPLAARALALRLLDHVPQVRRQAWRSLEPQLADPALAVLVLEVLLTASSRAVAPAVTGRVRDALLAQPRAAGSLDWLLSAPSSAVRRWAYGVGAEHRLLDGARLLAAVHRDPDQGVRTLCAEHLARSGDAGLLHRLLTAPSVPARLVAAMRILPDDLEGDEVEALLLDPSARVREHGRWTASRRGADVAAWARMHLDRVGDPLRPMHVVALLECLAQGGSTADGRRFARHAGHPSARVRLAALEGRLRVLDDDDAEHAAQEALLDSSPRVAAAGARSLVRRGAGADAAAAAWASEQPWSRRAAWRVSRAASSRDWLESDLRASADPDPLLAGLGRAGVRGWIGRSADLYWDAHDVERTTRLRELLTVAPLSEGERRRVAFCAGLPVPEPAAEEHRSRGRLAWLRHRGRPRRSEP